MNIYDGAELINGEDLDPGDYVRVEYHDSTSFDSYIYSITLKVNMWRLSFAPGMFGIKNNIIVNSTDENIKEIHVLERAPIERRG